MFDLRKPGTSPPGDRYNFIFSNGTVRIISDGEWKNKTIRLGLPRGMTQSQGLAVDREAKLRTAQLLMRRVICLLRRDLRVSAWNTWLRAPASGRPRFTEGGHQRKRLLSTS